MPRAPRRLERAVCVLLPLALSFVLLPESFGQVAPATTIGRASKERQAAEAALAKKVEWNYPNLPLAKVVADLATQADLAIRLDAEGLEEAGVAPDQLVSLDVGSMSLRSGLELLTKPLHLGYLHAPTGITITSYEITETEVFLQVYPVKDLIRTTDQAGEPLEDYDSLIDVLTSTIRVDSWIDTGGQGSMEGYRGCLAVSQSDDVHRQIERTLAAMRTVAAEHAKVKPGEVGRSVSAEEAAAVRESLARRHDVTLNNSLSDFVREASKLASVPLVLDPEGLNEAGISADQKVKADFRNTRLLDAIREVLRPLHLSLVVKEEYVLVTSQEKQEEAGYVAVYPVYDMVQDRSQFFLADAAGAVVLVDLVVSTVEPDTWVDNGGQGSIVAFGNPAMLVVAATDEIHEQVGELLTSLRDAGAAKWGRDKPADALEQRIYPLYAARRQRLEALLEKQLGGAKPSGKDKPAGAAASGGGFFQFGGGLIGLPELHGPIPDAAEVAELIEELLPDASWKEEGVILRPFNDLLIVRQRPKMLGKVEKLLRDIDAWHDPQRPWVSGGSGQVIPVVGGRQ